MPCRVIQCGTGMAGGEALRAIIDRPDLELAALLVARAENAGKDVGEALRCVFEPRVSFKDAGATGPNPSGLLTNIDLKLPRCRVSPPRHCERSEAIQGR